MKRHGLAWACPVMVVVLAACGGSAPPPQQPTPEPVVAPEPDPVPEPVAEEVPDIEEPAPEPEVDRRPLATFNNPSEPVTVGFHGAVIRIDGGAVELRVPRGALTSPRNILFVANRKHRGDQGKIGDVYNIEVQIPDQKYSMGEARTSRPVSSSSEPFVLKLPLPANMETANLAVETMAVDDKGRGKSSWTVVARSKIETADTGNKAVFEISNLPDAHVHLTSRDPG